MAKTKGKSQKIVKRVSELADSITALDYIKKYLNSSVFLMIRSCFKNSVLTFKGSDEQSPRKQLILVTMTAQVSPDS